MSLPGGRVPEGLDKEIDRWAVRALRPLKTDGPGSARVAAVNSPTMRGNSSAYCGLIRCLTTIRITAGPAGTRWTAATNTSPHEPLDHLSG
jgi:hypothetical protein